MSVYYLADGLGSTMATTDASGNIVNTYTYDPYGATTSSTGSQPNAFQFTGQATDATGLQYLRARYYDPSTGTFISSDPMGVSPTWPGQPYGYGGDNPVLNADPLGLVCFLSVCADRDGVSVGGHEAANGATAVGTVAVGTALTAGRIAQGCVLDVPMCWSATEDAPRRFMSTITHYETGDKYPVRRSSFAFLGATRWENRVGSCERDAC